jgi:hypothetical protein
VIRSKGANETALAISGDNVPGVPETTFQEFSAPLINSTGNVLFSARTAGKVAGIGLFLWTPRGIQSLAIPATMTLAPNDLLEPMYFSHDEAVFAVRGTSPEAALDQFFRAVAVKSFQELNPAPQLSETYELLPALPAIRPVKMLLILMEGHIVQSVPLIGDPTQPVMARRQPGIAAKPMGRILGQSVGARQQLLFAATTAGQENDVGIYCYCDGQVNRLTSPEEFLPLLQGVRGRPVLSLAGDSQQTVAFVVPAPGDSTAIYVASLP